MKNAVGNGKGNLPRRVSALFFACLFCLFSVIFPAGAEPDTSCCFGFALFEVGSGTLLLDKNYDMPIRPGPAVKLMTGLIACESFGDDPDGEVTVPKEALSNVSGRSAGLSAGQKVKKKELITLLLSGGFNDAANTVAILVSGDMGAFIDLMNGRALRLGMQSTTYKNATGLDDDMMYTTLRDTVTLAEAAAENALFLECSGKASFTYTLADGNKKTAKNPNIILSDRTEYFCRSARGLNAGYTDGAGYCAVVFATHEGASYICAAMGGNSDEYGHFAAIQDSLQWAFDNYFKRSVMTEKEKVGSINVSLSDTGNEVGLMLSEDLSVLEASGGEWKSYTFSRRDLSESLEAPVKVGDRVGYMTAWDGERLVAVADITVDSDVARSPILSAIEGAKEYLTGRAFRATFISAVLFTAALFVFPRIALAIRQRRRRYVRHRGGFRLK